MKKISVLFFSLVLFSLFLKATHRSFAQESYQPPELTAPTENAPDNLIRPDYNSYDFPPPQQTSEGVAILALFDKNGTAKIAAKITLDAENKQDLQNFTVFLPGKNIKLLRAVHEKWLLKKSCDYGKPVPLPLSLESSSGQGAFEDQMYPNPQYCLPNYVNIYSSLLPASQLQKDGLIVTFTANPDLNNNSQESILLLYETPNLAKKFLTNYHFKILTPQVPLFATTVQAGLLTKDGLYIKGSSYYGGNGIYLPNFKALEKAKNLNSQESPELNTFSNDILYQGIVRKSDSDISENSSFEIKGAYGKSMILLYLNEFLIGMVVFALLITGVYFLIRFISKKSPDFKPVFLTILIALVTSIIVTITGLVIYSLRNSPLFMK